MLRDKQGTKLMIFVLNIVLLGDEFSYRFWCVFQLKNEILR